MLLQQQLVGNDIAENMIFSLEELEKATEGFDEARNIDKRGHATETTERFDVTTKKSTETTQLETDNFINEVAILLLK